MTKNIREKIATALHPAPLLQDTSINVAHCYGLDLAKITKWQSREKVKPLFWENQVGIGGHIAGLVMSI